MEKSPTPTFPQDADDVLTITDLVDLTKLQEIQDAFAYANKVASTLTDIEGVPITRPSNHSNVCTMIRATERGLKNCIFSGRQLGKKAQKRQRSIQHKCYSIGFTDAAAPIIVNGRHIANWLIGQYHVGDVDEVRIREYALEIDADPEEMVEAFRNMPKLSTQEFERKLAFLEVMARELSLMGYQNLLQRRQNAELNRIREELEKYRFHLEGLVAERTAALQQANQQLTEEIARKNKLQKRQNRLVTAIESAVEAIIITSPAGKIIYVNPAFVLLTGYSAREAIGRTPRILKSGYHDDNFYQNLWQTISAGMVWTGRFINKKKDGTLYQDESTISPVKDDNGEIVNFVGVKKDITKEIQLEKQLQQAHKLESIGILAAGMAHEINTPIQYILGNTKFLKEVLDDFAEMQVRCNNLVQASSASGLLTEHVAEITRLAEELDLEYLQIEAGRAVEQNLEGIQHISTVVAAMKEFAHPGSTEKHPEDLNRIIETTVEISRGQWQDVAEIELRLQADLAPVPLMAGQFKQVFLDMIYNATYAVAEKQKSTSEPFRKGRIIIATRAATDHVKVHLADTGTGIPPAIIDKIFDPFFTTKPVGKGSGRGLSAAHDIIVEKHHGTMDVSSTPGQGTEFSITLPLGESTKGKFDKIAK